MVAVRGGRGEVVPGLGAGVVPVGAFCPALVPGPGAGVVPIGAFCPALVPGLGAGVVPVEAFCPVLAGVVCLGRIVAARCAPIEVVVGTGPGTRVDGGSVDGLPVNTRTEHLSTALLGWFSPVFYFYLL